MGLTKVDTVIVVGNKPVLANGTRLYDLSTDGLNLAIGQLGIFTGVPNSGNQVSVSSANVTAANQNYIQFIQRRDQSGDTSPLPELVFNKSLEVSPYCLLRASGLGAQIKSNSSWLLGAPGTSTNAVQVQSRTEYKVQSGLRGWHVDMYNGKNTPYNQGRYTTPDFTASAIYTTDAQRRDLIMHQVASNFTEVSNGQEMVMAFDSSASVATPTVAPTANPNNVRTMTSLAALAVGSKIIIGFTDEGQPITLTIDADLKQTFVNMAPTRGTWQLVPFARNTASNTSVTNRIVGGGKTAGGNTSAVDHLIFLSLDERKAAYNEVSQSKNRITVGADGGFDGVASMKLTDASEGAGYANDIKNLYANTQGHNEYIGGKDWQSLHVAYGNEIVKGAIYDVFVLDHCNKGEDNIGGDFTRDLRVTIAVQNFEKIGFTGYTGTANPVKAEIQTALNNWMGSVNFPHTTISV